MPRRGLRFAKPVPGSQKTADGFVLNWQGTALMGILNSTPDSFSDGGQFLVLDQALDQAKRMLAEGALIIDIGGESSRPGAEPVAAATELDRVLPLISNLVYSEAILSIDTSKPEVADAALRAGVHIVNDIRGLQNPEMLELCVEHAVPAVIMHMQAEPRSMQLAPKYRDVVTEVQEFLVRQARTARDAGLPDVVLDPGFGFGKTVEHNLELIRELSRLADLAYPVLLGASRKGTIHKLADVAVAAERDPGSLALHLAAVSHGASMLRVHNVGAHRQALKVWEAIYG